MVRLSRPKLDPLIIDFRVCPAPSSSVFEGIILHLGYVTLTSVTLSKSSTLLSDFQGKGIIRNMEQMVEKI
ncbi:MAG: hypothetical protein ACMUIA_04195 [bacterium]